MAWNQANHPSVILWCLQNESEIGPSYPFLAGYMFWLVRDYKERMAYNRFEYNGISAMGLSDFHGVRRLAFFAYRDAEP